MLLFFTVLKANAQDNLRYEPKLDFAAAPLYLFGSNKSLKIPSFVRIEGPKTFPVPIVEGKPYEAFFCRLEVRTEKWVGFGIKFHAGDYDNDMLKYGR